MNKIIFAVLATIVIGILAILIINEDEINEGINEEETIVCTADAMLCSDGTWVGRSGSNCEFICPPAPDVPDDIQAHIDSKSDLIKITTPVPNGSIMNPLTIAGEARGYWYFEASFPVVLTNWDGLIIAQTYATAQDEWMTENFVPFVSTLEFENPYTEGDPDFMKKGFLILQKDNPSGLPENDNALEIPVSFAP